MIQAIFASGVNELTAPGLTQWDKNQKLQITLSSLPALFQVHYSYKGCKEAYVVNAQASGGVSTVLIPNLLLQQSKDAIAWIYVSDDDGGDETIKTIYLPITPRQKPSDYAYTEIEIQSVNSAAAYARSQGDYAYQKALQAVEAIENVDTAVESANNSATAANTAASTANTAAAKIDGMTVSATGLAAGAAPTATISEVDGHKVITLGIPKGDTGATPQITVEVETGAAGSQAQVSVSGTAENPVIHLTIPKGDTGAVENLTINGKAVESGTITLTAADVGARPDSWTPTAADVGALPVDGTAANASKLGGKLPEYYIQPRNLLDNSDFTNPINQRGATSYTGAYGIDRWRTWDENTLTVNDGYITISGSLYQYLEVAKVKNINHTLAVCNTDGVITCLTKNPTETYVWSNGIGMGCDDGNLVVISIDNGDYVWAALYEGEYTADTLPPYVPKGYGAELAECRRYFRRYTAANGSLIFNGFVTSSGKTINIQAPELSPMRTKSVSIAYSGSGITIRGVSGYATETPSTAYGDISVSPYQSNSSFCASMNIVKTDDTAWGLTNNTVVAVSFAGGSILDYNADL